jgi:hypothetical protein
MGTDGYIPENAPWFEHLIRIDDETGRTDSNGQPRCIGRDPDILTAAGHPRKRRSSLVAVLSKAMELDLQETYAFVGYGELRHYCLDCADGPAEVRRCAVIDCPFWPYRMGRNPHNPKRGKAPVMALRARGISP